MTAFIRLILEGFRDLFQYLKPPMKPTNQERLYQTAKDSLGRDASPKDIAPDNLGCAETISEIIRKALPEIYCPVMTGTQELFNFLKTSPDFQQVLVPDPGSVIICVTGTGNGLVAHGHAGIIGKYGICSNDSRSGLFLENYTLDSWKRYFEVKGGFKSHYFAPRG